MLKLQHRRHFPLNFFAQQTEQALFQAIMPASYIRLANLIAEQLVLSAWREHFPADPACPRLQSRLSTFRFNQAAHRHFALQYF